MILERLPRGAAGKLQRGALPPPDWTAPLSGQPVWSSPRVLGSCEAQSDLKPECQIQSGLQCEEKPNLLCNMVLTVLVVYIHMWFTDYKSQRFWPQT